MADKGSLRHIRWYANEGRDELNAALFTASPYLESSAAGRPDWVSPLASEGHKEYWNAAFLERLGIQDRLADFQRFWPFSGAGDAAHAKLPTPAHRISPGEHQVAGRG